jgi:hypothetical protein
MSLNIQSNIPISQNQPNFKGVYILKGISKDVAKAEEIIDRKCGDEFNRMFHKGRKFFPGFNKCTTINLTDRFDSNQKNVKCLFATNEHYPNVINYNKKYISPNIHLMPAAPYAHEPLSRDVIIENINFLQNRISEIQQKRAPFKHAYECEKYGNNDPMSDFLIDSYMQAKERLLRFKETATVAMGEIKELNVSEVLKAIKENRFNFITGEIL